MTVPWDGEGVDPALVRAVAHEAGKQFVADALDDPLRLDLYATCLSCGASHRLEVEGRPAVEIELRVGTLFVCDCGALGELQRSSGGAWFVGRPLPAEFCNGPEAT